MLSSLSSTIITVFGIESPVGEPGLELLARPGTPRKQPWECVCEELAPDARPSRGDCLTVRIERASRSARDAKWQVNARLPVISDRGHRQGRWTGPSIQISGFCGHSATKLTAATNSISVSSFVAVHELGQLLLQKYFVSMASPHVTRTSLTDVLIAGT